MTRLSPEPRLLSIMTMKKPSTNADNCRMSRQTGSKGSTPSPRVDKAEGQRAVKMAPQSTQNGRVAGGGSCLF